MKIYTLTLSPAYDVHADIKQIKIGKESLAHTTARDAGGKGINISRALTSSGIDSTPIIVVGRENSDEFKRQLDSEGICPIYFELDGRIRENLTFHAEDGVETRISFEGFDIFADTLEKVEKSLDITDGDIVTVTGSIPSSLRVAYVKDMIKRLKKKGAHVIVDSRSFSLSDILEVAPYLIKPNEEEICGYLGISDCDFNSIEKSVSEFIEKGVENAIISLGERGAMLINKSGTYTVKAPKIKVKSTIGAGDSMIAGFIAARTLGLSGRDSLRLAVSFGSGACLTEGTKPPRPADVENIYKSLL